jgi:hypothetical protein
MEWTRPSAHGAPAEVHEKHVAFWNETTIQEFWSGKSWRRPDDANMLSYELARTFISLAPRSVVPSGIS